MSQLTAPTAAQSRIRPLLGGESGVTGGYQNAWLAEAMDMGVAWCQELGDETDHGQFMVKEISVTGGVRASVFEYTEAQLAPAVVGTIRDVRAVWSYVTPGGSPAPPPFMAVLRKTHSIEDVLGVRALRYNAYGDLSYPDRVVFAWDRQMKLLRLSHDTTTAAGYLVTSSPLHVRYSFFHTTFTETNITTGSELVDMPESAYNIFVLRSALYALARQEAMTARAQQLWQLLGSERAPGRGIPISETRVFKRDVAMLMGNSDPRVTGG